MINFDYLRISHRDAGLPEALLVFRPIKVLPDEEGGEDGTDGEPDEESGASKASHKRSYRSRRRSRALQPETSTQLKKTQPNGAMKMKIVIYLQLVDVSACSIFGNYESQLVPVEVVSLASR